MHPQWSSSTPKMKFFLLLAAVGSAMAGPEAKPWVYSIGAPLTYLHTPVTYTAPVVTQHAPLVYTTAAGCTNHLGVVVPCAHGGHIITTLAAAAPAAAEAPAVEEAERKKRDAEAEPEAEADPEADPWLLYGHHGLYGGYYGYGYHHPVAYHLAGCRNYLGALVPCAR